MGDYDELRSWCRKYWPELEEFLFPLCNVESEHSLCSFCPLTGCIDHPSNTIAELGRRARRELCDKQRKESK